MGEKIGVKEAAELLGLSKRTVYKKLRNKKLPGRKVDTKTGKKWEIDRDDVEEVKKIENEVIEVKEINTPVGKNELQNIISEVIQQRDQELHKKIDNLTKEVKKLQRKTILDKIKDFFTWKTVTSNLWI